MTVEELRDEILRKERVPVVCDYQSPEGEVHERTWRQATKADLDSLIAAARAEGAATERERIRNAGEFVGIDDSMSGVEGKWASCSESRGEIDDMTAIVDPFIIPRSVLAPEKESGK
jgi:hypothetical protein